MNSVLWSNSLHEFPKASDNASKCLQSTLTKSKNELGSTKSEDSLFAYYYKNVTEIANRQLFLLFWFKNNTLASFASKSLSYTVVNSHLQKLSTSAETDTTLQTSVNLMRAITMCSTFTIDGQSDNSLITVIGNVYSPTIMCWGKLCVLK